MSARPEAKRIDLAGAFGSLMEALGPGVVRSCDVEDYGLVGSDVQIVTAEPVRTNALGLSLVQSDTWQLEATAFRLESIDPDLVWTTIAGVLLRGAGVYAVRPGGRRVILGPHAEIAERWRRSHRWRRLVRRHEWSPWLPPGEGGRHGLPDPVVMETWPFADTML